MEQYPAYAPIIREQKGHPYLPKENRKIIRGSNSVLSAK
jgi:hypothetical protein